MFGFKWINQLYTEERERKKTKKKPYTVFVIFYQDIIH